jgi:HSP20 family protein
VIAVQLQTWIPFLDLEKEISSMLGRVPRRLGEEFFPIRPTTDVVRTEDRLVVTMELPGIDAGEVQIEVSDGMLWVTGEKLVEEEKKDENRYVSERRYGSFERRIPLPDGVDEDAIEAGYHKGVLTITVPLPEERAPEPHKVPVTVKEG